MYLILYSDRVSPARYTLRYLTSFTERGYVRWGGGIRDSEPPVPSRVSYREAAITYRLVHPFRSLITSGREPGQERDTPLVHPLLTSLPRSWRISLFVSLSRHRLTVSLVGRREGTGLLTSLPSLCFGPSVHASGRQGQGPARFLVPLVNRGPVARRASSVGTAHSVHSPAPGGGRNERSEERAVILPSHHGPSPSLPAEPGQGSDRLSLISSVPSLRRVTSFPVTSVRYALRSLRSLSFLYLSCYPRPSATGPEPGRNRRWSGRNGSEVEVSEPRTGINLSCHSLSLRFVSHGAVTLSPFHSAECNDPVRDARRARLTPVGRVEERRRNGRTWREGREVKSES